MLGLVCRWVSLQGFHRKLDAGRGPPGGVDGRIDVSSEPVAIGVGDDADS